MPTETTDDSIHAVPSCGGNSHVSVSMMKSSQSTFRVQVECSSNPTSPARLWVPSTVPQSGGDTSFVDTLPFFWMPARSSIPKAERKRKSFPEDQGLSKILALSQQAVDKKDAQFQKVLDKDHAKRESIAQAKKERARKKEESRKLSHVPSKSSIMEQMREKRRERSRERKKKRKAAAEPEAPIHRSTMRSHMTKEETKPKKKRVSFG